MHIVVVQIHVKPEFIEAFKEATLLNAQASIQEEGILQFDFLEQKENSGRFLLYEVYRESLDQSKHRETSHYLAWKGCVEAMLVEPRQSLTYLNIYPLDSVWER